MTIDELEQLAADRLAALRQEKPHLSEALAVQQAADDVVEPLSDRQLLDVYQSDIGLMTHQASQGNTIGRKMAMTLFDYLVLYLEGTTRCYRCTAVIAGRSLHLLGKNFCSRCLMDILKKALADEGLVANVPRIEVEDAFLDESDGIYGAC